MASIKCRFTDTLYSRRQCTARQIHASVKCPCSNGFQVCIFLKPPVVASGSQGYAAFVSSFPDPFQSVKSCRRTTGLSKFDAVPETVFRIFFQCPVKTDRYHIVTVHKAGFPDRPDIRRDTRCFQAVAVAECLFSDCLKSGEFTVQKCRQAGAVFKDCILDLFQICLGCCSKGNRRKIAAVFKAAFTINMHRCINRNRTSFRQSCTVFKGSRTNLRDFGIGFFSNDCHIQ